MGVVLRRSPRSGGRRRRQSTTACRAGLSLRRTSGTNRRQPAKGAIIGPVEPRTRIVVVSPHLDDGVLSLGAWMASQVRAGARVELLTVFACDPESDAPTKGWDARGGFRTEARQHGRAARRTVVPARYSA